MKKAAVLIGMLCAGVLHADEPRWTAAVPLWKVLSTSGELVAVHAGPTWYEASGPILAARLGKVEAVPQGPTLSSELTAPREVPAPLPLELRMLDEPKAKPTSIGPDLGPIPTVKADADSGTEVSEFALERTEPVNPLVAVLAVQAAAVTKSVSHKTPVVETPAPKPAKLGTPTKEE